MAQYYVDSNAVGGGNGSLSTPWKDNNEVSAARYSFNAGDIISYKRGGIYTGQLRLDSNSGVSGNPITFNAYDYGNKPVLSGFTTISSWTDEGDGIYSATPSDIDQLKSKVLIDNVLRRKGRSEILNADSVTTTTLVDSDIDGEDYSGMQLVATIREWINEVREISTHVGSTLTIGIAFSNDSPSQDAEYFIQNGLAFLTSFGDWAIISGTLYVYFGSEAPSDHIVKVTTLEDLLYITNADYYTFTNLSFEGATYRAVRTNVGCQNLTFNDVDINVAEIGFEIYAPNSLIDGGIQRNITNTAVSIISDNTTVQDNQVKGVGLLLGTQHLADVGVGIKIAGVGSKAYRCSIQNTGYNGIKLSGNNAIADNNAVYDACNQLADGACIYLSGESYSGREVTDNKCVKTTGRSIGIYLDDAVNDVLVDGNYVEDCGYGINVHNAYSNTISNNVVKNCENVMHFQTDNINPATITGNTISGNKFYAGLNMTNWISVRILDGADGITDIGTFSNNKYFEYGLGSFNFETRPNNVDPFDYWTFAQWQSTFSFDSTSNIYTAEFINVTPTTYYISGSGLGNDNNNGTSEATPWATINKLNASWASINDGDIIKFECGYVYQGEIEQQKGFSNRRINITSYGSGNKPEITGFEILTSWTSVGNGVYKASAPIGGDADRIYQLVINNIQHKYARWPKTGWRIHESADNTSSVIGESRSITDNELTADLVTAGNPDFSDGEVVIKKNHWTIDRNIITDITGNIISYLNETGRYSPSTANTAKVGSYGYFFQNSMACFDLDPDFGDWVYDEVAEEIYVYFGAELPGSYTVKYSKYDHCYKVMNYHGVKFSNLKFTGSNRRFMYIDYLQTANLGIEFENCDIEKCETGWETSSILDHSEVELGIKFFNCTFSNIQGRLSIHPWGQIRHYIVDGCTITNQALIAGMADRAGSHAGIDIIGMKLEVTNCIITNSGYNGIAVAGRITEGVLGNDYLLVKNNKVENCNQLLNDGGAFYTYTHTASQHEYPIEFAYNIGIGGYANGLYSDGYSRTVYWHHNTIKDFGGIGFHSNEPRDNVVEYNKFFNCGELCEEIQNLSASAVATNNIYRYNEYYKGEGHTDDYVIHLRDVHYPDVYNFGIHDYNIYYLHNLTDFMSQLVADGSWITTPKSFSQWQTDLGFDANSLMIELSAAPTMYYNDTDSVKNQALPYQMRDSVGNIYMDHVDIQPYESVILLPYRIQDIAWDKSNTYVWEDSVRALSSYDINHPTLFLREELNQTFINTHMKTGFKEKVVIENYKIKIKK